ncbi:4-diphosphocytidyl-2C-methyl-D-erythritol synthase [Roseibium sp. TrichSKD4]|uniref:NTP transferase domain-containing protein n=1 Tax=Roseibium sp. TrichSKD4 TaxID=744980 RepID=UPI0001E5675A|nr:molybdopterin-binding/glycosyltransferase family 2 protein [Roseibium sp. TrichSKD4]EFO32839.1 4-diphosphocytidyl-2C-methyl-D-erythritol synthase [Roseibium sp. TrichSKD4]
MEFGVVPTTEAKGCVLAHSTKVNSSDGTSKTFKKGRVLSENDVAALLKSGINKVSVARLAPDDVNEDQAADRLARAANGGGLILDTPFTGRVNLHADCAGLLVADEAAVNSLNRIDPAITLATLPNYTKVGAGRMVATAKIIPFAASNRSVREAEEKIQAALAVKPFHPHKVGLVATTLDHLKPSTMDKTRRVLEERLEASGSCVIAEKRVPHSTETVASTMQELLNEGAELLILFGASAVVDRQDVLPTAIEHAGGRILHFGMPVDPGNLLLLADLDDVSVIGAPGCARSPKENGFDWILDRVLAKIPVASDDITQMGVGGLLMEIESRPQPREPALPLVAPRIGAVVLAAGKSSRMGAANKLLVHLDGKPVLTHVLDAAQAAKFDEIVVVTGHMREDVADLVGNTPVQLAHNPHFSDGMASSIKTGVTALSDDLDGIIILLGDMPNISEDHLNEMRSAFQKSGQQIVVATANGKRGNPVLWHKRFFDDLKKLTGDIGARHLIAEHIDTVHEVEIGSSARIDLDTPEALLAAGGILPE